MDKKLLRIGLELDLITNYEAIKLAEKIIMEINYPNFYLDIATLNYSSTSKADIMEYLFDDEVLDKDKFKEKNLVILFFLNKKYRKWEKLQIMLINYYYTFPSFFNEENYEFWSRIKDDFSLRNEGFSGCMKMPKELTEFINAINICPMENDYFSYLINNLNETNK